MLILDIKTISMFFKLTYLVKRQDMHGLIKESMQSGREKTPGCGAKGTGPPPLTIISLVTSLALCLANTVAKVHLNNKNLMCHAYEYQH